MRALAPILFFVLNTLNSTLYNVTIVGDKDDAEMGKLRSGWKKSLRMESDSIEVVFTLTPDKDAWYATDKMPIGDVILTDSTMTYEVILVDEKDFR